MLLLVHKMRMYETWPELHDAMTEEEKRWANDHAAEFEALIRKKYSKRIENVKTGQ